MAQKGLWNLAREKRLQDNGDPGKKVMRSETTTRRSKTVPERLAGGEFGARTRKSEKR